MVLFYTIATTIIQSTSDTQLIVSLSENTMND